MCQSVCVPCGVLDNDGGRYLGWVNDGFDEVVHALLIIPLERGEETIHTLLLADLAAGAPP